MKAHIHDWILLNVLVLWEKDDNKVRLVLDSASGEHSLEAVGVTQLSIPRENPWGPSFYVNGAEGPATLPDGRQHLSIEMQSGDIIEITAREIGEPVLKVSA